MVLFWPMAKYIDEKGDEQTAFTTDGCLTLTTAKSQIEIWDKAYNFKIVEAWIDVRDEESNVNFPKIDLEKKWFLASNALRIR